MEKETKMQILEPGYFSYKVRVKPETTMQMLERFDPVMAKLLQQEEDRQRNTLGLIASENYASPLATFLEGSVFTNKNTEGYPGRRFVGGCEFADEVENLAIERLKQLFGCEHANLQAANATIGNISILHGLLKQGDTILSMSLSHGGHLSHGAAFHVSGKMFNVVQYGVSQETERIDLEEVKQLAQQHNPKMIICGASSYPQLIDYAGFAAIAKSVGAFLWVDCAHDVGLIAAGVIPSPVPHADVVSFSTQKTLRGPRGCGVILCRQALADKIDRAVFPNIQGGPKMDMIAARAVLFKECMSEEFKLYSKQVLLNAQALAQGCLSQGLRLITGGTDTHLIVADVTPLIPSGKEAEDVLNSVGIVTNKNMIPFDALPPNVSSGIRIGSPFLTTRGVKEAEMYEVGVLVGKVLQNHNQPEVLAEIRRQVAEIAEKYPLFAEEWLPR